MTTVRPSTPTPGEASSWGRRRRPGLSQQPRDFDERDLPPFCAVAPTAPAADSDHPDDTDYAERTDDTERASGERHPRRTVSATDADTIKVRTLATGRRMTVRLLRRVAASRHRVHVMAFCAGSSS